MLGFLVLFDLATQLNADLLVIASGSSDFQMGLMDIVVRVARKHRSV